MTRAEERPARPSIAVPFEAHIELLESFLAQRASIVERIQTILNAQRKPAQYLQDTALLSRQFEECFFALPGAHHDPALKAQLDEAHWASGFKPRKAPGLHNDLVDAAEMMKRGFVLWQQTRWPGQLGRVRYAHTLFNLYVIRRLALLTMRLWDAGTANAPPRLAQVQRTLDALWQGTPADQPVLVRDARWLIPVAQSPTTDELWAYFDVAQHVAASFTPEDRLEIHMAAVRLAGGHLRSQLRHVSMQNNVGLDDHGLVLSTRCSNALDIATLMEGLVPLLEAYEHAVQHGDGAQRLALASAILQGVSPDPELFLNRLDLLAPYSMIEHLFIAPDRHGRAAYTPAGRRHLELLGEYEARVRRMAKTLLDDCPRFRPDDSGYSPFGALYGFSSNLLEHMALKTLTPDATTRFGLEDVFSDGGADKRAWVSGWRKLPHIKREVIKLFEYPQRFAEEVFERIERALRAHVDVGSSTARAGQLLLVASSVADAQAPAAPELAPRYIRSSDRQIVANGKAKPVDEAELLHSRNEGEYLVSFETQGGWLAISKDLLTEVVGAGGSARVVGLPPAACETLRLMCPKLAAP